MSGTTLFPVPSLPPSPTSPQTYAGITPQSTKALQSILEDNHKRWHCYFDSRGLHNHTAHWVIALWSLGADASTLEAAYKQNCLYQKPLTGVQVRITDQNLLDHVGNDRFYEAYLAYFDEIVGQMGIGAALEKYVFAENMNFVPDRAEGSQLEMVNRFLDGLLHPMIHVGYGAEFGLPGMVAEGLAQTLVHRRQASEVISSAWFGPDGGMSKHSKDTHAFSILARILKDPRFHNRKAQKRPSLADDKKPFSIFNEVMDESGDVLRNYVEQWTVDTSRPDEVERKVEELAWANSIIYGIGGWNGNMQEYNADFFHMHFVTSSTFLTSILVHLTPRSQAILLRSYFAVCLGWWIGRGRPGFDIAGFFAADATRAERASSSNPWFSIFENALVFPDDHMPKLQRSLARYSAVYGSRVAGERDFSETELEGAELLDGSLFVRIAALTGRRLGRVRNGEKAGEWDRRGFYKL